MTQKFQAVFKGAGSACLYFCKVTDEGGLFIKVPRRLFPLLTRWRFVAGNMKDKMTVYEERPRFSHHLGERGDMIRFYNWSLEDYEADYSQINSELLREIESKRAHASFLAMLVSQLKDIMDRAGINDRIRGDVLNDHQFYVNELKPIYLPPPKTTKIKK